MHPRPELDQLCAALREVLARAGLTAAEASRRLERHPRYLTRVLGGGLSLKVAEVFRLLEEVQTDPDTFFDTYFPLGGSLVGRLAQLEGSGSSQGGINFARIDELIQKFKRETGDAYLDAEDWTARLGNLLKRRIRSQGHTMRGVAQALALPVDRLAQAARGRASLTFEDVFAALGVIGLPPGRFFAELFMERLPLAQGLQWSQLLAEIEPAIVHEATRLAEELLPAEPAAPGATPPAKPKPRRKKT